MPREIRRVVTGHNAAGKSIFIIDEPCPHVFRRGTGSVVVTDLWETHATPADNGGNADAIDRPFRLPPPRNGSVLRIIEYPPDKERVPALAGEREAPPDGSGRHEALDRGNPRPPGFHKTSSSDYAIGRNLCAHGRGRGAAQGGRRADPARHQPRLEQPHRCAGDARLRADRRQT